MTGKYFTGTRVIVLLLFLLAGTGTAAQENTGTEQQLEELVANNDAETEDDDWLQRMEYLRRHPLNLNTADAGRLQECQLLTPLQIGNLLTYRKLFGNLVDVYELQAVPGWPPELVRRILPFVTVAEDTVSSRQLKKRFLGGEHQLLWRVAQVLERARGYIDSTSTGNFYAGSPQRLLLRYRYAGKNQLQYGFTAEKDAGEQLFRGAQKAGFDHYSAHLFITQLGRIKTLALGDFTVNLGQGLIHWQNLAFRKSADALAVKRMAPVLRPYNAAGETHFFRGAGITLLLRPNMEATVFGSFRNRDANLYSDTLKEEAVLVRSLPASGLHRTQSEMADRHALKIFTGGTRLQVRKKNWQIGLNGLFTRFGRPLQKMAEPYALFAIAGNHWANASVDYSWGWQNLHFFGEAAVDKNGQAAQLHALLASLDPKLDISLLYRKIAAQYQSVSGNAFTENSMPANETGLYTGITLRPVNGMRLDVYADVYRFPFLRYGTDAPSGGRDYLLHLLVKPNKQAEFYLRYKREYKMQNRAETDLPANTVQGITTQRLRAHVAYKLNTAWQIRQRTELVWVNREGGVATTGFSVFAEVLYKPLLKPFSASSRVQYFETGDYDSRIYAYESDVLYSFSIPALYGKGYRYYVNLNYDFTRKLSLWFRWAQTVYPQLKTMGSGLDEINGNRKSDYRIQLRWVL